MDAKSKQQLYKILRRELGPDYMNQLIMLGTENLRHRAGKELTSFVAYPDRGDGGNNGWRGNCSPKLVADLIQYALEHRRFYRQDIEAFTVLDPMSGYPSKNFIRATY